jgi:hypothetical protein
MGFDWKSLVRGIAPTIATALGGPAAGLATRTLSTALLGKPDGKEEEIADALAGATAEQLLEVRKLDQGFAKQMAELGLEGERLAGIDRASARDMQVKTKDRLPGMLAIAITAGFFGLLAVLCCVRVPPENGDMVKISLGSLGTSWIAVVTFYFGSSAGSRVKDEAIGRALTASVA